uniref:Serine/threonine protein kinase n=1 Tax=Janibacter limosus TaxID=53458 RepID=A0AC61U763_9MICO|nr:serine/threonine-protein kinase [Janibacter limosus]
MTDDTTPGLIGDRYETVRPIGRGGMGIVWLARDTVLGRQVAVKQIGDFPGESEGETRRAMREARAAAALNHPNVVAVSRRHRARGHSVAGHGVRGRPHHGLRDPRARTDDSEGAADPGAQLAGAPAAAHKAGIVHRDVKPANVLIGGGRPKLGDFGIARSGTDDQLTQTGLVTGTPSYMAPEVAVGDDHGEAADVWALGATIYFAVEGKDAYPSRGNALATLRSIAAHPPRRPERAGQLEPVLADMLSRDVARRGSMARALRRLESIAAGGTGGAPATATHVMPAASPAAAPAQHHPGPLTAQGAPRRGGGWLWVLLVAGPVALLVAGIAFAMSGGAGSDGAAGASGTDRTTETTTTSTTSDGPITEAEGRRFVEDYFSTVTSDRDAARAMLAPERQTNRAGYDDFWSDIDSVTTSDISVDEASGEAAVTLTYQPKGRDTSVEQHTYELTRIDGHIRMTR